MVIKPFVHEFILILEKTANRNTVSTKYFVLDWDVFEYEYELVHLLVWGNVMLLACIRQITTTSTFTKPYPMYISSFFHDNINFPP